MALSVEQLKDLPSTFYRVAVKCLIFNDANEVLVVRNDEGAIEIPGGGWEHGETLSECVERELQEEVGLSPSDIGPVKAVLSGMSDRGWAVLRVAVEVQVKAGEVTFNDEEIVEAFYVSKADFAQLDFCPADASFATAADQIWADR